MSATGTDTAATAGTAETGETWVGREMRRKEDPRMITGRATYTDNLTLPGTLYVAIVRVPKRSNPNAIGRWAPASSPSTANACPQPPAKPSSSPSRPALPLSRPGHVGLTTFPLLYLGGAQLVRPVPPNPGIRRWDISSRCIPFVFFFLSSLRTCVTKTTEYIHTIFLLFKNDADARFRLDHRNP